MQEKQVHKFRTFLGSYFQDTGHFLSNCNSGCMEELSLLDPSSQRVAVFLTFLRHYQSMLNQAS